MIKIIHGDCIVEMAKMPEASVDSIVTDPPYHLTNKSGGPHGKGVDTPYSRSRAGAVSTGFMGMAWDGGNIAQDPEMWAEALRVLKPGGYLLAFSGTRTYHRMVCAIEDAGFEIRDQIGWCFGSGFPKSHNGPWGGTALKPAWEPIVMARKPLIGTVEANWLTHRTGALNIDGCRVEFSGAVDEGESKGKNRHADFDNGARKNAVYGADTRARGVNGNYDPPGRWPSNLVLSYPEYEYELRSDLTPEQRAAVTSLSSGTVRVGEVAFAALPDPIKALFRKLPNPGADEVLAAFPQTTSQGNFPAVQNTVSLMMASQGKNLAPARSMADAGSAARFFKTCKWTPEEQEEQRRIFYTAKASSHDRNDGLQRVSGAERNKHATVKNTTLMRWLVRLITPPGGTVLDMFCGSGSTLKAAEIEGFSAIGIEMEIESVETARRRVASDLPLFADVK